MEKSELLCIRQLAVEFGSGEHAVEAVRDVSLDVGSGSIVALIGESGSGKSVTARSVFGLLERSGRVTAGEVWLDGTDLLRLKPRQIRRRRGKDMAMIFQDPANCLNPVLTVGTQMMETIRRHRRVSRREARALVLAQLARVGLPDPAGLWRRYPFQISGGMCQRVMIALALVSGARLLIADEPTTALDVMSQAQILDELSRLRQSGIGILLITHDLSVVAEIADRVYVMKAGRLVEAGDVYDIFERPRHDYTRMLLDSRCLRPHAIEETAMPRGGEQRGTCLSKRSC
ncbi:ABC transporter ATP-binding protein [Paenibacillus thiaminolyticus]|uniref:ABC transporter ATP-binding protein n=1 Tax=Paenibacillus thiaminolyticus TaxID=49283 RepID=A0AAP9IZT1_PANTH|nr:ABC transporter ATP-binding protein [Paenibacillus thiaminolyticus]MCY9537847.1 ABC transporter ATP-binding protein [Paenibacillus thiaminolyticus]MCY9605139.1 ABC transporter ATP-binding protein [Paenibacillus thiaminolyticus]MCY9607174.1 ABC transporter ATP-binding protein [Paenibacillus thiaminolyticus]MCY9616299.1 ABC transporter ATP-binding protein [Paenibacillus thiaminolyticus]MCY9620048.1 ABC transporter ATP-binding protein [Paenibacillus thiaminolyticus]